MDFVVYINPRFHGDILFCVFQVIDVTLSELSSLKPNAKVYEGSPNSVLFATNLSSTKSQLKKEKLTIEKRMNATKVC